MSEFRTYTLEQLCIVGSSKRVHLSDYVQQGVPFYRSKEVIELSSGKNISEQLFISSEKYSEIKSKFPIPQENDILITAVGTIGEILVVKDPNFYFKDGNLIWLRNINFDIIDIDYLYYFFKSDFFQKTIKYNNIGAVQKALTIDFLKTVKITLPSLDNQRKLISVLKSIDKKLKINNQINQELEAIAKTLYDYWFVQFDFPDQNGKPYKSSGGKMVYNPELKREIPEGWGVESVGNLLDKVTKAEKIENNSIEFIGEIPVIDQSQKYIVGFTNNEKALLQPQDGHVIFGDHTRVVKYINFDYARGADGTQVLISNNENISNVLLYHMIEDFDLSNYGYARHFKFLKEKLVIVPDKKISLQFANKADVIYKKIRNNIFENQELTQLRDWLLPMLMNGQVKVE